MYAPNIVNEYTSIGGTAVSYDAAGNLSADHRSGDPSGTAYNYHYDYENRLTAIDTTFTIGENQITIAIAKFAYDALGRRVEKTEEYMSGTTHHYYYDSWRVLRHERDTHNIEYVYGNYLDEVCMQIYAGATDNPFYLVHDHLYSPVAILDQNGDVYESREYSAYGYTGNNTTFCEIAFTGQRQDTFADRDLKLMYYKNRYYDTETGRFLTRDPIGVNDGLASVRFLAIGLPVRKSFSVQKMYNDGMSLYEYANSNSILYFDTYGESTEGMTAIFTILRCGMPYFTAAHIKYGDRSDKFRHCWVSCMIARDCGKVISLLGGLTKETRDLIAAGIQDKNMRDAAIDSLADMVANQVGLDCAGPETWLAGVGWITRWFRQSCECCCKRFP